jgi:predicted  nucleic acid-binding Zn-ribbon protein
MTESALAPKPRGRKASGTALSSAERQKLYRERMKAKLAAASVIPLRDDKAEPRIDELNRKLSDALEEVARLNRENDRLTIEKDALKRRLKAKETREADLCKRLDAAVAERDQARAAKVQAEGDLAIHRSARPA